MRSEQGSILFPMLFIISVLLYSLAALCTRLTEYAPLLNSEARSSRQELKINHAVPALSAKLTSLTPSVSCHSLLLNDSSLLEKELCLLVPFAFRNFAQLTDWHLLSTTAQKCLPAIDSLTEKERANMLTQQCKNRNFDSNFTVSVLGDLIWSDAHTLKVTPSPQLTPHNTVQWIISTPGFFRAHSPIELEGDLLVVTGGDITIASLNTLSTTPSLVTLYSEEGEVSILNSSGPIRFFTNSPHYSVPSNIEIIQSDEALLPEFRPNLPLGIFGTP